jgi:hypothetical protein
MDQGTPGKATTAMAQVREQFSWLPKVLLTVATVVLAWGWWALAFLPSARNPVTGDAVAWPPHLPVLLTQFELAVFGSLGAALVVVVVLRRAGLALLSVVLGYATAAWFTLHPTLPATVTPDPTEQKIMLVTVGLAAVLGLALGVVATRGPQRLGFLGLLGVGPVVGLVLTLLHLDGPGTWLARLLLAALLVLIAWRRWTGVLLWPVFFLWLWLLSLVQNTVRYGTETLRHPGGSNASVPTVLEAMRDFVPNAWSVLLANAWHLLWPALFLAAVVLAWRAAWPALKDRVGKLPLPARKPAAGKAGPAPEGD